MYTYRADIGAANDNKMTRRRKWLWGIFLTLTLILAVGYWQGKRYFFSGLPELPTKESMWAMNVTPNLTLLDKNGVVIGHRGPYYGRPLKLEEMPPYLPAAFLAIEDQRFYEHPGIDRKAIFRAMLENAKTGRKAQGGSTLTQQLLKNMVLTPEKTYKRKVQEMWLSYKMEQILTKPEILELYLNRIDMGNRSFGVEAAAQRYFGKSAAQVTLGEAALLAGLPQAPSGNDPTKNPKRSAERTLTVLRAMMEQGKINSVEMAAAINNPAKLREDADNYIDDETLGHVFDMVAERAVELTGSDAQDLVVRTTIDPALQKQALKSIQTIVSKNEKSRKVSDGALVSIEVKTGAVRALVGGRSYSDSKFNRAAQAKRQPGSAFKAFVYAAALENGYSPGTVRIDQPINIAGWEPENFSLRYLGPMTIREALKLSINTVSAQVTAEIGPDKVVELARRFGITDKLGAHYSIALGASEVTLVDLTSAFMVFANEGLRRPYYMIDSIHDTAGTQLYVRPSTQPERVFALPYAQQMNVMLQDVVQSGTGHGAKLGRREAAGKTGTSQDYRDGWFVGYTADYATGVWLGNDDNSPMNRVTGGLMPADAWKTYMLAAHKGLKRRPLADPLNPSNDAQTQALVIFYQGLSEDFIAERNLANGLKPVTTAAQQND